MRNDVESSVLKESCKIKQILIGIAKIDSEFSFGIAYFNKIKVYTECHSCVFYCFSATSLNKFHFEIPQFLNELKHI